MPGLKLRAAEGQRPVPIAIVVRGLTGSITGLASQGGRMRIRGIFGGITAGIVMQLALIVSLFITPETEARTTVISSLPYTASQIGTAYSETLQVTGTRLSSSGHGITVTGSNIVIKLDGDTIAFGTSNATSVNGLNFSNAHHIRVEGGWIIHGRPAT